MQNIFIVGSKGIPGAYGGYETFVDKLTEYHSNHADLKYHVACKGSSNKEFEYHNARCFQIKVPNIGPAQAIYYDAAALEACCAYIKKMNIKHPVVYVLACRIGPAAAHYKRKIHRLGGKLYVNPDGHEWMRQKWSVPVRKYWKISERMMVKHADLLVCDSQNIERYIKECYKKYQPATTFIAYGTEIRKSRIDDKDEKLLRWYEERNIHPNDYYLVVGRFVPENNYETMIREFMRSSSERDFVLITNVNEKFLRELEERTGFTRDPRIKFAGTVYDGEMLMKIRENAYAYLHGHEVGGTNPSLLEALAATRLNLLLDVGFNREVAEDGALYWTKEEGNLSNLLDYAEHLDETKLDAYGKRARQRMEKQYSWQHIADLYEELFET